MTVYVPGSKAGTEKRPTLFVTVLIVLLIVLFLGALPQSPLTEGREWGYYPSGALGLVLAVLLVLVMMGHV